MEYSLDLLEYRSNLNFDKMERILYFVCIISTFVVLFFIVEPFFNISFKVARMEFLWTMLMIVISPFGTVRFRDFFVADILTSLSTTLNDSGIMIA
jgi:EXS family